MTISQTISESTGPDDREVPWTQNERYYFAYGSNMNEEQMRSLGVRPLSIAVAKLPEHRISFHGYSRTWDGAEETVVAAPGRDVWGVIYKLRRSDGNTLDSDKDVRLDGTGAHFLFPTTVLDTGGKKHLVLLYKKDILGAPEKPSREYLDFIVQGALQRGLPSSYIEELRRIESGKAAYEVPLQKRSNLEFFQSTSCSECGD
jgi:gamma-glutamylcyclotransferase